MTTPNVVETVPDTTRPYDFSAGDERRPDRKVAIELARARVAERGCRQQVRLESPAPSGDDPLWLVQDL